MTAYNLACIYALQGRSEEALSFLEQAVRSGLAARTATQITEDEDLKSLRKNARFEALAAEAKKLASQAGKRRGRIGRKIE